MPLKTQPTEVPVLNLTPMIDVLFQLIIFFMVGTQFVGLDQQIDIDVPQVARSSTPPVQHARRTVAVNADGTVHCDGRPVSLSELHSLLEQFARQRADATVLVLSDRHGSVQNLAEVLQVCAAAGIHHVGLGVQATGMARHDRGQRR